MRYDYEALNDETFQKLAQALVIAQHPNAQALPVGQPDGGRDAFLDRSLGGSRELTIFQVKFTKHPQEKDEREKILEVINLEKNKVKKLVERGATEYILVTNVQGTAHLSAGSIDRARTALSEAFKIPSQVWWRDDLDRRIDNAANVKWSYPEILRAVDILQLLVQTNDSDSVPAAVVNAFLAHQYLADRDVKFKQVELSQRLTDLFVDLPLRRSRSIERVGRRLPSPFQSENETALAGYVRLLDTNDELDFEEEFASNRVSAAAAFFLNMPLGRNVARFVVEGAPGQGKSTVTQYLCQANRLRLLNKPELQSLPERHREAPIRIPFRADLRDFAAWVSGRHPFTRSDAAFVPPEGRRSLESFLAMQVSFFSGGLDLTQDKLVGFLSRAHSVIVLDGFDEVADIDTRRLVVEEIRQATERLDQRVLSLQVLVTSRPAAFANSPGFPDDEWTHLELADLRRADINAYRDKWILAQRLETSDAQIVSETLAQKLEQPHLRDLARNPMQLAILLQLIHVQGSALPDKRTTLYEKYMELFFNRESEKSAVVRDNRDLLMAIHGYLAWILQIQAERGGGQGSIPSDELRAMIYGYLQAEEYDTGLADVLLRGMVERVVALVARVEGMYEFEVQPLREYFAGKYLYETSPYSPPGNEKAGTRPERFEALAKSMYWTNVTRFFCGFYDKGELPALVDGIEHLSEEEGFRFTNIPRRLAMMLLSDWVFSQSPRAVRRLISHISEEPGFSRLIAGGETNRAVGMALPERSGQRELCEACLRRLDETCDLRLRRSLRRIVAQNSTVTALKDAWFARYGDDTDVYEAARALTDFALGRALGPEEIKASRPGNVSAQVTLLAEAGKFSELSSDEQLFEVAYARLLDGELTTRSRFESSEGPTYLELLGEFLLPYRLASILYHRSDSAPLSAHLAHFGTVHMRHIDHQYWDGYPHLRGIADLFRFVSELFEAPIEQWQKSTRPWSLLVDKGFQLAPRSRLFDKIAILSSSVRSASDVGTWSNDGWLPTPGLVQRLRFARKKSGNAGWWRDQIEAAVGTQEIATCLTTSLIWVTGRALPSLIDILVRSTDALSEPEWRRVYVNYSMVLEAARPERLDPAQLPEGAISASTRLATLLLARMKGSGRLRLIARKAFSQYDGKSPEIIRTAMEHELGVDQVQSIDWKYAMALSRLARDAGSSIYLNPMVLRKARIPEAVAEEILSKPNLHSPDLVAACERSYAVAVGKATPRVSTTADLQKWFERRV